MRNGGPTVETYLKMADGLFENIYPRTLTNIGKVLETWANALEYPPTIEVRIPKKVVDGRLMEIDLEEPTTRTVYALLYFPHRKEHAVMTFVVKYE